MRETFSLSLQAVRRLGLPLRLGRYHGAVSRSAQLEREGAYRASMRWARLLSSRFYSFQPVEISLFFFIAPLLLLLSPSCPHIQVRSGTLLLPLLAAPSSCPRWVCGERNMAIIPSLSQPPPLGVQHTPTAVRVVCKREECQRVFRIMISWRPRRRKLSAPPTTDQRPDIR